MFRPRVIDTATRYDGGICIGGNWGDQYRLNRSITAMADAQRIAHANGKNTVFNSMRPIWLYLIILHWNENDFNDNL